VAILVDKFGYPQSWLGFDPIFTILGQNMKHGQRFCRNLYILGTLEEKILEYS
jgi:hypothetical protein